MRAPNLTSLRITQVSTLQIDKAGLVEDPVWFACLDQCDEKEDEALMSYVLYYLGQETLLAQMPNTTGPASVVETHIEVPSGEKTK